jgi:2-polyprenyl-3-methyl-5-hydroxy-6-metoxy-1,4-benzoquinol methylase
MSSFQKYRTRGAYHWLAFSRNPRKLDLFTRTRYDAVVALAGISSGEVVVDMGSGDGALTWHLARANRNGKTIGVEPESEGRRLAQIMNAENKAGLDFFADTASLPPESADVVVCAEVIEHVDDPEKLLGEIRRLLKPSGRLIITTPVRLTEKPFDSEHVHEFFPEELATLIGATMTVERQTYSMSVFAIALYRWCPVIFLRRGVLRILINSIFCVSGWNFLQAVSTGNEFWITQLILARKRP